MNAAQAHRAAQLRLGVQVVALMRSAFRYLDPRDLDGTAPAWLSVATPIVATGRRASAQMAAAYLTTTRTLALGPSAKFTPTLARDLPEANLRTSLIVTGPVSIKTAIGRMSLGDDYSPFLARVAGIAEARSSAAAMRHALDGGRETILQTIRQDDRAVGWHRVTGGKACEFCSMLAGRGAVYGADSAHFRSHDGCSCSAEPVFA